MRFLIDNSLSPRLARHLNDAGHEAVHVRDLNLARASDEQVFERAAEDQRVLVAQDTDFGTILALRGAPQPSLVLFRMRGKSVEAVLPRLLDNLAVLEEDLTAGAVVVFEDTRVRLRRLPLFGDADRQGK
jgi:predicted nuclease of predicted toxin-antitoxin system